VDARALVRSLSVLAVGALAVEAGSRLIAARFADAPVAPDLVLRVLPYSRDVLYVTGAAVFLALAVFAYYILRYAPEALPEYVAIFGIMYLLRAATMVLTPLANARGEGPAAFAFFQYGMFPSGHTAATLLFAWLTDAERAPRLRRLQYGLLAVVIIALLVSRGHYSVDIAGGALLAYFVHREWTRGSLLDPVKRYVLGS
jgi:membrane-associated phospholipid phosphatase